MTSRFPRTNQRASFGIRPWRRGLRYIRFTQFNRQDLPLGVAQNLTADTMNLQRKRVHGEDSRFFLDDLKTRELEIHSRLVRISGMGSNLFSELRPAVPGVISGEMETTCQRPLPSQRSFAPIPELTSFGLPSNGTNGQVAQKPCRSRVLNGKRNGGALRPLDLTPRETEVLIWVAQGKTNYEIGVILSAATRTICKHVQRILFKLNVENRTAAAAIALATLANAKR